MVVEIILGVIMGVFCGTITGLIPGVHSNVVALASLSLVPFVPLVPLAVFIISVAITHTCVDVIPSIYLGAPDEDVALSSLPGHEMLRMGHGHQAVCLTIVGSCIAVCVFVFIVPLFLFVVPFVFSFLQRMMGWFLIQMVVLLLYFERGRRLGSFIVFLLAGFLGFASLNSSLSQPLFPLLTGLFGTSTLLYSMSMGTKIPKQIVSYKSIPVSELKRPALATAVVSPICSFLPGLGSSQAAIIGSRLFGMLSRKQFLILIGSVNTLVMAVSFLTVFLIGKTRTGAAIAFSQVVNPLDHLVMIISLPIIIVVIASLITRWVSKLVALHVHKIRYEKISFLTLTFLVLLTMFTSGLLGLFVLISATLLGLTCVYLGVRKGLLMGSLLVPTILFYLPF